MPTARIRRGAIKPSSIPTVGAPQIRANFRSKMYARYAAQPAPEAYFYAVLVHDSPYFFSSLGGFTFTRAFRGIRVAG